METPLVTLYGHDSEVICVDISTELDMAVSGAKVHFYCLSCFSILRTVLHIHTS